MTTIPSLIPPTASQELRPPEIENPLRQPPSKRKIPRLTPVSLLEFLQQTPAASITSLTAHFRCSIDRLSKLLNNPEFLLRHKIQTQLAFLQSRLAANQSLPDALAKTISLMNESEKPEVARRAAAALIQIAGLPIRTAMQPAPVPIPEPSAPAAHQAPQDELVSDDEARDAVRTGAFLFELETGEGINLPSILSQHHQEFVTCLRKFCDTHNIPYTDGKYAS